MSAVGRSRYMSRPNILLVVLDSVRARNTSLHGYGNRTTPFLEAFAEEARVYEQARAPGIHSVASHASIFTGYHVAEHGVRHHESDLDSTSTIWYELEYEHGYNTGLFSPNFIVTVTSNLADPFDIVDGPRRDDRDRLFESALSPTDIEGHQSKTAYLRRCIESGKPVRAALNGFFFLYHDRGEYDPSLESGTEYVDSFLDWSASREEPWAACLNLMDAHYPYLPIPEFEEHGGTELRAVHRSLSAPPSREVATTGDWWKLRAIESLYDDCIRQADAAVERLVSRLRDRGDLEDTLVVITSDHGEGFGEWSIVNPAARIADHSWGIHEVLTHVPLVVSYPDRSDGATEGGLASLTEFPAVVHDVIDGSSASFTVDEHAIASTSRLEDPELVLPDACPNRETYRGPWRAVYEQDGETVLKYATREEMTTTVGIENAQVGYPVSGGDTDLVQETFGRLGDAEVIASDGNAKSLNDDVERRLEELGYLR